MLPEGKSYKELVKAGLVVEEDEITSLSFLLEALYSCAVFDTRVSTEENSECMTYNGMALFYPFFLFYFL